MNGRQPQEPSPEALERHAAKLPPIFGQLVWELDRIDAADYAGTTSGGALSATGHTGAHGRAPGRLSQRGPVVALERAFNDSECPHARLQVILQAVDELRRLRPRPAVAHDAPEYRTRPPGRPRSTTAGQDRELRDRITRVTEMRSGLTFATLLAIVGPGRKPHADLVASVLAELDAGTTLAAVSRAIPEITRRTVERWQECRTKGPHT